MEASPNWSHYNSAIPAQAAYLFPPLIVTTGVPRAFAVLHARLPGSSNGSAQWQCVLTDTTPGPNPGKPKLLNRGPIARELVTAQTALFERTAEMVAEMVAGEVADGEAAQNGALGEGWRGAGMLVEAMP